MSSNVSLLSCFQPVYGGRQAKISCTRGDDLDNNTKKIFAGLTTNQCECLEIPGTKNSEVCSTPRISNIISDFVRDRRTSVVDRQKKDVESHVKLSSYPPVGSSAATAVQDAATILGCSSEACILSHPVFRSYANKKGISSKQLDLELATRFKTVGPRESRALLNNFNIDETLQRWALVFPDFYPCPFAMMDFDNTGSLFSTIDLAKVYKGEEPLVLGPGLGKILRPNRTFGCIVNTDTSLGPGKHWVAIFIDCRGDRNAPWTVEFFNSVGRPPLKPLIKWMERTRYNLARFRLDNNMTSGSFDNCVLSIPVTNKDHQESQTECGMYSLFYIRRRLEGVPYQLFDEEIISDNAMIAFRKHVFRKE